MNINVTSRNHRNSLVLSVLFIGLGFGTAGTAQTTIITITNTSSSYYRVLNLDTGLAVTNIQTREGVASVVLSNNFNYEVSPGQANDQGSHYFHIDGSGQINSLTVSGSGAASDFFNTNSSTSLTIGSIQVHFRLLSGTATSISFDPYFAAQSITIGTDGIVNLTPTDRSPTAIRGDGFIGNWKNTFAYGGAQRAPFQLGPNGILSMTDSAGMGTIVPSSVVYTNFVEGGIGYGGFRFTLDRSFDAHPTDGSQWLFFTVPEPTVGTFCWIAGAAVILVRRRWAAGRF